MENCIFCKIIRGDIPSIKVYEDKFVLAFLDIGPVNKGHTLVIPKKHYETFLDLPEKELNNLTRTCQKVANAVVKGTNADAFNLMNSNKRAAGQLIDHVHFHIIPRFKDDGFKHWPSGKYKEGEEKKVVARIKSFL